MRLSRSWFRRGQKSCKFDPGVSWQQQHATLHSAPLKPCVPNGVGSMFNVQCSVFNVQCSVFSVQCSVFSVQCSVCAVQASDKL